MFSKHVTKDISAYCHGELSSEESKRFAEHIISCVKCRTKFEEIKLGIRLAEQLPQLTAPDSLWREVESALGRQDGTERAPVVSIAPSSWRKQAAIAAAVLVALGVGAIWLYKNRVVSPGSRSAAWQVTRLDGTPKIGSANVFSRGSLGVGVWLEPGENCSAQIGVGKVGSIGM